MAKRARFLSLSCPEPGYSLVSTEQSCTGGRSLPKRAAVSFKSRINVLRSLSAPSPSRFQLIIKHRRTNSATNSESCGSSAFPASRSMDLDLERRILLYLFNCKFQFNSSEWRASDDWVLNEIHGWFSKTRNVSMDQIKQHVNEFEERVKRHKEQAEEIVQDKTVMLEVFDYVTPDIVVETPENELTTTEIYPTSTIKRVKRTSYPGSSSHLSDSIGQQFSRLLERREDIQDFLTGPFSMACCVEKLEKLGFEGPELYAAIEMLKNDIEARQIFIKLRGSNAKDYVFRLL